MTSPLKKRKNSIEKYFQVQKKVKKDENDSVSSELAPVKWTHMNKNDLNISYAIILDQKQCTNIFERLESELEYFTGDLARVKVFGKYHDIPRQQVCIMSVIHIEVI